jgi:hypothetical protein
MEFYFQFSYSQGGLTSGRRPIVKIIGESLSQHEEKHVVPTPLSVGKGRKKNFQFSYFALHRSFIKWAMC